jgi:branched-chain amino acid transport system permease protein
MVLAWSMWLPLNVGQFCFSTVGSAGIGAYTLAKVGTALNVPFILGLIAALVAGLVFGILPGILATRLSGFSFALATLALAEVVQIAIINIPGLGGAYGLPGLPTPSLLLPVGVVVLLLLLALSHAVYRSRTGQIVDLLENDELQARALGVGSNAVKFWVLLFSSGVAAVGGGLMASYTGYLSPNQFDLGLTTDLFAYVIVGGLETLWGPLLGAAVLTLIVQLFSTTGPLQGIIFGIILAVAILVRPNGVLVRSGRLHRRHVTRLVRLSGKPDTHAET